MRRPRLAAIASGFVLASACTSVCAQIYKCPDGQGYSLQQAPCAGLGQSGGRLLVLPNGGRAPVAVAVSAGTSASASAGAGAGTSASGVPRIGRVLGRTPVTPVAASVVAHKPN